MRRWKKTDIGKTKVLVTWAYKYEGSERQFDQCVVRGHGNLSPSLSTLHVSTLEMNALRGDIKRVRAAPSLMRYRARLTLKRDTFNDALRCEATV